MFLVHDASVVNQMTGNRMVQWGSQIIAYIQPHNLGFGEPVQASYNFLEGRRPRADFTKEGSSTNAWAQDANGRWTLDRSMSGEAGGVGYQSAGYFEQNDAVQGFQFSIQAGASNNNDIFAGLVARQHRQRTWQ
jgi:hypothetical protein